MSPWERDIITAIVVLVGVFVAGIIVGELAAGMSLRPK